MRRRGPTHASLRRGPMALRGLDSKELEIHVEVAERMRAAKIFFWHTPNGEKRTPKVGARLKFMGVSPGVFDFHLEPLGGIYAALEIKAPGKRLSKAQREWSKRYDAWGWRWACVDSIPQAIETLRSWGYFDARAKPDAPAQTSKPRHPRKAA